jgi:tetratricopeptide (TPR) repeat protein
METKMTKTVLNATIALALLLSSTLTFADTKTAVETKAEAQYQKELASAKTALDAASKNLENDFEKYPLFSKEISSDYKALSEAYYKTGNLELSIEYALHALKIDMKIRKDNDPLLARLYFDTGNKYYMHKQHPTAILYMEKAAQIYNSGTEKESLELANTYEGISSIYINLEDYAKSLTYNEKCLAIRKKKLDKNDEALQRTLQNIEFTKQEMLKKKP